MTVDLDYFTSNNDFNSNDFTYFNSNQSKEYFDNYGLQKINNFSIKIDFKLPYQWAKLEFGGKISLTETSNDIDISRFNTTIGPNQLIVQQKDYFTYNENIQALYFSASKELGSKWEAKIGLRGEFTQNKGESIKHQTN